MVASFSKHRVRRHAGPARRRAGEYFRAAFEYSTEGMFILADDGRCVDANPAACTLVRLSKAALIGRNIFTFIDPDNTPQLRRNWQLLLERGELQGEYAVALPDEPVLYLEFRAKAHVVPGRHLLVLRDGAAQRQAEREKAQLFAQVQRERERLNTILDTLPVLTWEAFGDPTVATQQTNFVSRYVEEMLGYSAEEVAATPDFWLHIMHPADRAQMRRVAAEQFAADTVWTNQFRLLHRDGRTIWVESTITCILDEQDAPVGLRGVTIDITERKRVEEELRQQKEILQTIFDHIPLMINFMDGDGRLKLVNRAWERTLLWSLAEIEAQNVDIVAEFYPDSHDRQHVLNAITNPNGEWGDFKTHLRDGRVIDTSWAVIKLSDGTSIGIGMDITERKRVAAARLAQAAAEQANRAKSEFLSRMSHELRTPLNSILGFSELLQMTPLTTKQAQNVDYVLKAGEHLLRLINEVLDIARIESGRSGISLEPVEVRETLQEALDLIQPLAAQHQIRISADDSIQQPGYVQADRQRLRQVLLNILTNAVKYNQAGGQVALSCVAQGSQVRIQVRDTGPGIAPDQLPKLFTPFERLGAERSGVEGTGLGLALSRHLVESMHGAIGVESALGQGSTFWVVLERVDSPLQQLTDAPVDLPSGELPITATHAILYIEDNLPNLKLIESILEQRPGIKLLTAMQGLLGIEMARHQQPDLILLDLHLPDLEGEAVLRRLQDDPHTRAIPVAVISADATANQIQRLRAAGAYDYLTKPLAVREFLRVLAATLQ